MPDWFNDYLEIDAPERREPSVLLLPITAGGPGPGVTEVMKQLQTWPGHEGVGLAAERVIDGARWELEVLLPRTDGGEPLACHVGLSAADISEVHLQWSGGELSDDEQAAVLACKWSLELHAVFGERPLWDFHAQLKLAAALAPEAVAVLDLAAARTHEGAWLRAAAAAQAPPRPSSLFAIHAVHDTEGGTGTWLHTHGLLRCGTIELEMLGLDRDASNAMGDLINIVAAMFIENGPPPPGDPFVVGQDIELTWKPWQLGMAHAPAGALGTEQDRDEVHSAPSGLLWLRKRRWLLPDRFVSPQELMPLLEADPVLYLSDMESDRMALRAGELLASFAELFEEHKDSEGWGFLVKLGYPTGPQDDAGREHLWFEVHGITLGAEGSVDATLINQPYGVESLHEGDRGVHDLGLLSDWTILCRHGRFGPDTLPLLRRRMSAS